MAQIKVLVNSADFTLFTQEYFRPVLTKYFDIVEYDSTQKYNISEYLVATSGTNTPSSWYKNLGANKILVDGLWEYHLKDNIQNNFPGMYVCSAINYFWINEHYCYLSRNYDSYVPNKNYTHKALMPMRLSRYHRDQLLKELMPQIDDVIYSYVSKGKSLPDDDDQSLGSFQRFFNPMWYNSTYFSIVAESVVLADYLLVTEKIFKPIAFEHPFIVYGQTNTLKHLHNLGFETFENLFNESYDTISNDRQRLNIIVNNVTNFVKQEYDTLTLQKLKHNRELFYNAERVEKMFVDEIINPIIDYVNS